MEKTDRWIPGSQDVNTSSGSLKENVPINFSEKNRKSLHDRVKDLTNQLEEGLKSLFEVTQNSRTKRTKPKKVQEAHIFRL